MRRLMIPLLGSALIISGCSLAPKYERPGLPVPSAWPEGAGAQEPAHPAPQAADMHWREFFADARLRSLVDLALGNNRDLRVAALNVEKARALYRIQRSELYPNVGVLGSGEIYRLPEKVSGTGQAETVEQYSVNLGMASWELDFFGRIRSLKESALNQYLATEEARSAAEISLVAAVASGYLMLAADQESLGLAEATLEAQQATHDLIRQSRDLGISSDLDVRQAQSQVEAARVAVARLAGAVAVDRNALALLAGAPLPDGMLPGDLGEVGGMSDVSPALPSEVLLCRPDILTAEFQLKAAHADIGAARAAFFPRIALTAAAGTMSNQLSTLFGSGTGTWSFIPQVTVPIFAGGALRANLRVAEVDREIALARYEKAIQTAFREVSDALALTATLRDQEDAQRSLTDALSATYRLSEARYRAGIDNYLGVLVAQRELYAAQEGLVSVRLAGQINRVTLFKVLGGGASDPGAAVGQASEPADLRPSVSRAGG
jgi:multidrug efflux system outer membrane protein